MNLPKLVRLIRTVINKLGFCNSNKILSRPRLRPTTDSSYLSCSLLTNDNLGFGLSGHLLSLKTGPRRVLHRVWHTMGNLCKASSSSTTVPRPKTFCLPRSSSRWSSSSLWSSFCRRNTVRTRLCPSYNCLEQLTLPTSNLSRTLALGSTARAKIVSSKHQVRPLQVWEKLLPLVRFRKQQKRKKELLTNGDLGSHSSNSFQWLRQLSAAIGKI